MPDRRIEIVGHGGAGAYYPGNSRPSFERAIQIGVDRVECDLQRSRDGQIVLVHDEMVPTADGARVKVAALTAAELAGLVPDLVILDDLIEMVRGQASLMLDVKQSGYEEEVIAAIHRHNLSIDSSISTTYASTLRRLRRAFPHMRMGLSVGDWSRSAPSAAGHRVARPVLRSVFPIGLPRVLGLLGASETMLHHRVITRRLVDAVHASGQRVNAWTVDDEEEMQRMAACGVDGIISNRPDVARRITQAPRSSGLPEALTGRPG